MNIVKNDLFDYGLEIYQDKDAFKFSLDSILLAEFVEKKKDINKAPSETAMKAPVDSAEPQLSSILNEETQDTTLVSEASFFSTAYGDELSYDEVLYPEAQAMQKIEEEQQEEEPDLNDAPTTDEMCAIPIKQVKFKKE